MRILWSSNSPFVTTGYGTQTACACRHLKDMGHDVAIFAFYGLQGSKIEWVDIPIYPNNPQDWGIKHAPMFYKDWKADIFMTLVDVWVLGTLSNDLKWCLPSDAILSTNQGEIPIGDIVENRFPVKVKGFKNGKAVYADILAYQKIPYRETGKLIELETESHKLIVTSDNEILTQRGWIKAGDIVNGDMVNVIDSKPLTCYTENHEECKSSRNLETSRRISVTTLSGGNRLSSGDNRRRGDNLHSEDNQEENSSHPVSAYQCSQYRCPPDRMAGQQNGRIDELSEKGRRKAQNPACNGGMGIQVLQHTKTRGTISDNQTPSMSNDYEIHRKSSDSSLQCPIYRYGNQDLAESSRVKLERVAKRTDSTRSPSFVYDLKTSTENLFANGILIHNCPWLPVDHDPVPYLITEVLKKSVGLVKPIAMTKFGQKQLAEHDIEAYYIPHSIDTNTFKPDPQWRATARERYSWQDKFVIGTVATNHDERKNWTASLKAIQMFDKMHPGEVIYYMHTNPMDDRGIDLVRLRNQLAIDDITKFPSQAEMIVGIPTEVMAHIYNSLDVFLLPTKGEGFGIPIMEAQACGVPVITTKCTGQAELMAGGYFIEDLRKVWTKQSSWQFDCRPEEIVERLEQAYQDKKTGKIKERGEIARAKALEYDDAKIYTEFWPPVLGDIERRLKEPKNLEGIQQWRVAFIPRTCLPRTVLDIGCGVTQPYRKLLEELGDYTGIDLKEGKNVIQMDAHHLNFQDGEFGFVWLSEVLEHVEHPEQVLAEAKRVGRHGVCLFSTPQTNAFKLDPDHKIVKLPYAVIATGDGLISW